MPVNPHGRNGVCPDMVIVKRRAIQRCGGFSLIELLLVMALIGIIVAMAVPGLLRARLAANEGSAIASLRAIGTAQASFASTCGRGGFAQSLADLGRAPGGSAPFIPPDLAGGEKAGYLFRLEGRGDPIADAADTCNATAAGTRSAFLATANPLAAGASGARAFGIDNSNVLRWTGAAAGITDDASYASAMILE